MLLLSFISLLINTYIKRIKREIRKKHVLELSYQKELSESSIKIMERERERIALDIHDSLVNRLRYVRMVSTEDEVKKLLSENMEHAREISHNLTPPLIEMLSILELIKKLTLSLKDKHEVSLSIINKENFSLSSYEKLNVFRIFQEVVSNVEKHAEANCVTINFRHTNNLLSIIVSDNGIGIPKNKTNSLGMKSIELRSQVLKASYKFKSNDANGTTFIFVLQNCHRNE